MHRKMEALRPTRYRLITSGRFISFARFLIPRKTYNQALHYISGKKKKPEDAVAILNAAYHYAITSIGIVYNTIIKRFIIGFILL